MKPTTIAASAVFCVVLTAALVFAQPSRRAAPASVDAENQVRITVRDGYRYITSNGIPEHATGAFPNRSNPHTIRPQRYTFRVPAEPEPAARVTELDRMPFGVALNGVVFDPGTAEYWKRDRNSGWRYEAIVDGKGSLGIDQNHAHVQPTGAYHYHAAPTGLIHRLQHSRQHRDPHTHAMTLVGYAADGFPIYYLYGYADPDDPASGVRELSSSYRLKKGERPSGSRGPGGRYDGTFTQDFEYVPGAGDLDECNGRTGVTPEYPDGTYYYVITDEFPYIPRCFRGAPDPSFQRRGPGGPPRGGQRGEGGRRPPPR